MHKNLKIGLKTEGPQLRRAQMNKKHAATLGQPIRLRAFGNDNNSSFFFQKQDGLAIMGGKYLKAEECEQS